MINNGIVIIGFHIDYWISHQIDISNKVNGRPICFIKNQTGGMIGSDAGQIILANCTNITIENQKFSNCSVGIELGFSKYINTRGNVRISNNTFGILLCWSNANDITGNILTNNNNGIYVLRSEENNITCNIALNNTYGFYFNEADKNNITGNDLLGNEYGIYIQWGSNTNRYYHNNFINNIVHASDPHTNQWDNGYPSGGNYWSNYTGVDINSTPAQDVPPSDGIGDTPYKIDSNTQDNYPLMNPIKKYILIKEGWNLISIPFNQTETKIHKVLFSIRESYDTIQSYYIRDNPDPWKHNHTSKPPHLNDFETIDHNMGFWIRITKSGGVLFQYSGTRFTENQSIPLHPGWNMVGYPSLINRNRTAALNNLTFGVEVDAIWTFNAATQTWEDIKAGDYFEVGRGYWVHATQECVWEVPL
jgi:parallel beta-helix repeat protein